MVFWVASTVCSSPITWKAKQKWRKEQKENHCEEETRLFILCESEFIKHQTEEISCRTWNESDEVCLEAEGYAADLWKKESQQQRHQSWDDGGVWLWDVNLRGFHWNVAFTLFRVLWILRVWRSLDCWKLASLSAAKRWMSVLASLVIWLCK